MKEAENMCTHLPSLFSIFSLAAPNFSPFALGDIYSFTEGKFSPCISVYSYPRKENLPDLEEQSVMKSIKEVEKKTRSRPGIYNALRFGITSLVQLVELNNESTLRYSKGGGG